MGLGVKFIQRAWTAVLISDIMEDISNAIKAIAKDKKSAMKTFSLIWDRIITNLEGKDKGDIYALLEDVATTLGRIELNVPLEKAKKISLIGEIYVRRDALSRQGLVEKLANQGFVVKIAPVSEWIYYTNYIIRHGFSKNKPSIGQAISLKSSYIYQEWQEKKIKKILEKSGLYEFEMVDVGKAIDSAKHLINPKFNGEAILTVGMGMREILHSSSGIISIGPFACMPSRVAEAILNEELNIEGKEKASKEKIGGFEGIQDLPFLAIETDGNPYPQIIDAKLETFCMQAERIHERMMKLKKE